MHGVRARVYKGFRGRATFYYPNYWGTMPMAVFTFLERYDFAGKTIRPFCTHEGSGLGGSVADIRKLCPGADVENALAIRGGSACRSEGDIKNWLKIRRRYGCH